MKRRSFLAGIASLPVAVAVAPAAIEAVEPVVPHVPTVTEGWLPSTAVRLDILYGFKKVEKAKLDELFAGSA